MTTEMEFEDPLTSRIKTLNVNGETILRVPPSRNAFALVFLLVWLGGWSAGGVSSFGKFMSGGEGQWFLGFWLCAWAVGWVVAAGALIWQIFGMEVIGATNTALTHSYRALLWSRTRRYNPASITKLRWHEGIGSQWSRHGNPSSVAFDYGAKTIHMVRGADSGEGEYIVSALRQRLGLERARP